MTPTFPTFSPSIPKWSFRKAGAKPAAEVNSENDEKIAECDFLRELVLRNPEAIQSDLGLMALMTQYPRYF